MFCNVFASKWLILYPCSVAWSMTQTKCVLITLLMVINILPDRSVTQTPVDMHAANHASLTIGKSQILFFCMPYLVFYIHKINVIV